MKKEKKVRQYRSNQGRSPRQQESNEKVMMLGCIGFGLGKSTRQDHRWEIEPFID